MIMILGALVWNDISKGGGGVFFKSFDFLGCLLVG